jgi:hypothetical protein
MVRYQFRQLPMYNYDIERVSPAGHPPLFAGVPWDIWGRGQVNASLCYRRDLNPESLRLERSEMPVSPRKHRRRGYRRLQGLYPDFFGTNSGFIRDYLNDPELLVPVGLEAVLFTQNHDPIFEIPGQCLGIEVVLNLDSCTASDQGHENMPRAKVPVPVINTPVIPEVV